MNEQNPNYRPNALSRFYETVLAGGGTVWPALGWAPRNYVKVLAVVFLASSPFWLWLIYQVWGEILTLTGDTVPKTTSATSHMPSASPSQRSPASSPRP